MEKTLQTLPGIVFDIGLSGRYYSVHTGWPGLLATQMNLVGQYIDDVLTNEANAVIHAALALADMEGHADHIYYSLNIEGKTKRFACNINKRPPDPDDTEPRFTLLCMDISGTKTAERQEWQRKSDLMCLCNFALLSPKEKIIHELSVKGFSAAQIAAQLHRSERTVDSHRAAIKRKITIHERCGTTECLLRSDRHFLNR